MLEIERNIFQIFPINIFVEQQFLSEEHCDLIFESIKDKKTHKHNLIGGDGVSSYNLNDNFSGIFERLPKPINDIREKIQERIDYFTDVSKMHRCRLGYSWFNVQNEDSRLHLHSHGFSIVSGALYINIDESSSSLDFLNPNYSVFSGNYTDGNVCVVSNRFERGTLVIFPSYLVHGNLKSSNHSKNRVVISFNTDPVFDLTSKIT
jgi:uncharacterized protein (TIGR02466 family)